MLNIILNIISIIFLPLLTIGLIRKVKAFWQGRKGANIIQPFWDIIKLFKKETIYSTSTSWIYRLTPVIMLAGVIFASLFVPIITGRAIIDIPFSFVIFSYILGFSKFFSLISALDCASSFEGMGASREACFSTIVEPAFFILMGTIVAITKINTFENLKLILINSEVYGYLIIFLAVICLFIMLLVEGCRVPVDDPNTHLELTMIHEVMILDNSGVDLAFITLSSAIKMFLIESLIANLLIPLNLTLWITILLFLILIFIQAIIIGTIESIIARLRMSHVFEFIFIMSITSLLVLVLVVYKIYGN